MKVYILADRMFPSGNAGGVRIKYLSKALMLAGFTVSVISLGDNKDHEFNHNDGRYYHEGINYLNQRLRTGFLGLIDRYLMSGFNSIRLLKMLNNNDKEKAAVILYTSNLFFGAPILGHLKKKFSIWFDVVEWFQVEQFRYGVFSVKYWLYLLSFKYLYSSTNQVIAISTMIQKEFIRRGCKTILVPALYDGEVARYYINKTQSQYINLIYSGQPGKKEEFTVMLRSLLLLDPCERSRIRFHITGTNLEFIKSSIGGSANLANDLMDCIILHPWLIYEDLLDLYSKMHFLFFVRRSTKYNEANFPTKMVELMSFSVPPLTTKVGDYGNLLVDGFNSIVIEKPDLESTVYALRRVLDLTYDEIMSLGLGARKTILHKLDYRLYRKRFAGIYLENIL